MWAMIPETQVNMVERQVRRCTSQDDKQRLLLVVPSMADGKDTPAAKAVFEAHFAEGVPAKFHGNYVELWYGRQIPGHGLALNSEPWETHPQMSGPPDTRVFVYDPLSAERKHDEAVIAENRRVYAEKLAQRNAQKAKQGVPAAEATPPPAEVTTEKPKGKPAKAKKTASKAP